jgi:GNAT superfamily N-acetyltransferase
MPILALFDAQERQTAVPPLFIREEEDGVVRHVSRQPERMSHVVYSRLTAVTADAAIQTQISRFRTLGRLYFTWDVYDHDTPPDLQARLAACGFVAEEPEMLLVLDLADLPPIYQKTGGADVRRLTDPAEVADVVGVETAVWGANFGWLARQLTDYLTHHPHFISLYAAYVDGLPASAAWSYFPAGSQFVGLWGGATLAEQRGRGLYSALIAARAAEARQRGARFLWVNASDDSRLILEKRGFRLLAVKRPFIWTEPEKRP